MNKLSGHARARKARRKALDAMVKRFEDGSGELPSGKKAKPLPGSDADDRSVFKKLLRGG